MDQQYWAWLNTEWNAGRLTRPGIALQSFRNHPRTFLKTYPLQNNYDPQNDGIFRAHIFNGAAGQRPGSILKTQNMHTTESFTIQAAPGRLGEGYPFWLHGLHTGQSNQAPVWYLLDGGGPDIMLTAKLTGCTFIARPAAGHPAGCVEITHLQPNQETGIALNTRMNVHGQHAYGRLRYDINVRSINVIGVRQNGGWKIYAQKLEKHNLAIRSVTRIFPPE